MSRNIFGQKTCKFCGIPEGAPDRKGRPAHINRDNMCAPCYNITQKVMFTPDKVKPDDMAWFEEMCRFNHAHGMFVPLAQRRVFKAAEPKRCKICGDELIDTDPSYTNYCLACAYHVRHHRTMPSKSNRKQRSDAGKPRGPRKL